MPFSTQLPGTVHAGQKAEWGFWAAGPEKSPILFSPLPAVHVEMGAVTGEDRQPSSTGELVPSQGEKSLLTAFGPPGAEGMYFSIVNVA